MSNVILAIMLAGVLPIEHEASTGFLTATKINAPSHSIPLKWSPTAGVSWTTKLPGYGQSSPVVHASIAYVTAIDGPNKEENLVAAHRLSDGSEVWRKTFPSNLHAKNSVYNSRSAPTPVVDEDGLVVYFESGDVISLDFEGQVRWSRSLTADYGKPVNEFGLSASPVQTKDAVIILVDDVGPSYLIGLSKVDGKTLWKTERSSRKSWSSPYLIDIAGKPQVVCSSGGTVDGYDPQTGSQLWTFSDVGGNTAATPLPFGEGRFLIAASPGRDGENSEKAKQSNLAMQVTKNNLGQFETKVLWRTDKATPTFASPIVHRDFAYWINRAGVVYCLDANTGELKFAERTKQPCWATPLGIGDFVYFFGKDGVTSVLRSGPTFEVLSENLLWDPDSVKPDPAKAAQEETEERRRNAANFSGRIQYSAIVAEGGLLIRTGDVLYYLKETSPTSK